MDTEPGASVTETNILSFMGVYEVVSHTPHEHHHCDRIFGQRPNCDFSSFLSFFSGQRLPYMIKPSSVTKRNNMEGVVKCMGMVYTPHQCWYSDRKSPYWEKSLKVSKFASGTSLTIPNTLPSWSYQHLTLCTTLGTFLHLPGAKMTILASNSPLGRERTILQILKCLKNHPKVVNALN